LQHEKKPRLTPGLLVRDGSCSALRLLAALTGLVALLAALTGLRLILLAGLLAATLLLAGLVPVAALLLARILILVRIAH
jgi:hypothetical protein